ncbi:hypothetical protein OESDEN_11941 [Oesophagostomum dentatum]|uniref:Uncharacterized protein n=1 Tax=Oesophagostomum dentatum TaxID=61180 RepID=A0A0B1SXM4_OESDE|nr:hypothetical protein OESDEN_11941 [Oesophagostomum dentatum]
MGSLGVGRIFQVVQKPTLRLPFSDLAFVSTLPEDYLPDLVRENIGRVKWDEFRRDGDEALEEDAIPKPPFYKRALKLLKILLPHVGLNVLLLSYIAMGAIMFIWLEADHELQSRKEKLQKIYTMYDKIINESTAMCSGTVYNSSQVSY